MFQSFDDRSDASKSHERISALRAAMAQAGLSAYLIPRSDRFMGEYVAAADERLAWLTGFTGSAGAAVVTADEVTLLVDGRYTLQAEQQVDRSIVTPMLETGNVMINVLSALKDGAEFGFDPWLHPNAAIRAMGQKLPKMVFSAQPGFLDKLWQDRPAPPTEPAFAHEVKYCGVDRADKISQIIADMAAIRAGAALITLPDQICWLLNIRGNDIPRVPVVHAMAILQADGTLDIFTDPHKFSPQLQAELGGKVRIRAEAELQAALKALGGNSIAVSRQTAPHLLIDTLERAGADLIEADLISRPKARKTPAEIAGAHAAHLRDGAAMVRFLHWFDEEAPRGALSEIDVITKLEALRAETGRLRDISFETICGAGPNGAIVHYRATEASNRKIAPGDLVLVDSGAQYLDGTTDITRTLRTGPVSEDVVNAYTRVLKGMIAISCLRWPEGRSGRDLDAVARMALWQAGQDYAHGTGHGVGSYLSVHEGPQGLSSRAQAPLEAGMILSNEPGYYRAGAFGIRLENLIVVEAPEDIPGGEMPMMRFSTLTRAPFDRRLINLSQLGEVERQWLNTYHTWVYAELAPLSPPDARQWLGQACAVL